MAEVIDDKILNQLTEILKDIATSQKRPVSQVVLTKNSINDIVKELLNGTYKFTQKTNKILSSDIGRSFQQALREQVDQRNSFLGKLTNWKWLAGQDTSGSGLQAIRTAEKISGGIESIFSGKALSGTKELLSAFPKLAKFMGGPLSIAFQTVATSLIAFDRHLTKINQQTFGVTGGFQSDYLQKDMADRGRFILDAKSSFRELSNTKDFEKYLSYATQNLNRNIRQNTDTYSTLNYGSQALMSMGVSENTALSIMSSLLKREGLNSNQSNAAIKLLTDQIKDAAKNNRLTMSEAKVLEETSKSYEINKKYNLSMEWINRQIIKFNDALDKGTRTAEDFASVQKTLYGGESGQLAGWGMAMVENALASGVKVPKELLDNLFDPRAFSEAMRDPDVIKKMGPMYKSFFENQNSQIGGENIYQKRFATRAMLKAQGFNVSTGAINDLVANNFDFAKAGLLGVGGYASVSKRKEDQVQIEDISRNFKGDVKDYIEATKTFTELLSNSIGKGSENIIQTMKEIHQENQKQRDENIKILNNSESTFGEKQVALLQTMTPPGF